MKRGTIVVSLLAVFVVGIGVGTFAQKKPSVTPAAWSGKSPAEATTALLELAEVFAGSGSWENIHVGRVYYLTGDTEKAEAIFSRYTGGAKVNNGDLIRIGRVYARAGDWDKAKPIFDKVLAMSSKDADWMVKIGAFYNIHGDREKAEELFAKSFALSGKSLKNTLAAASSYAGIEPRKR